MILLKPMLKPDLPALLISLFFFLFLLPQIFDLFHFFERSVIQYLPKCAPLRKNRACKAPVISKFDHAKSLLNSTTVELQRYTMTSQLLKVAEFSNFQRCRILQFPELIYVNLVWEKFWKSVKTFGGKSIKWGVIIYYYWYWHLFS